MLSRADNEYLILMVDDDADDRLLIQEAAAECNLQATIQFVDDGMDLMDYLYGRGRFTAEDLGRPILVLLDLNMPRKDGREALREIKTTPSLCHIPVVVLTTSRAGRDVHHCYALGASGYIPKPSSFEGLVDLVRTLESIGSITP